MTCNKIQVLQSFSSLPNRMYMSRIHWRPASDSAMPVVRILGQTRSQMSPKWIRDPCFDITKTVYKTLR